MRISSIKSTIKLSDIEKCIKFESTKEFRQLFRGHVITATIEDINQLDIMLLSERRDCVVSKPILQFDVVDLQKDSFNISTRGNRYIEKIDEYLNTAISAYDTLVNEFNIDSEDAAISVLPVALKTTAKVTFNSYNILKLFKHMEVANIIHAKVDDRHNHSKKLTFDRLFISLFNDYMNTIRNRDRYSYRVTKISDITNITPNTFCDDVYESIELLGMGCGTGSMGLTYNTSIMKHLYSQMNQTVSIDIYINILTHTELETKREPLRYIKKKPILPDAIKEHRKALIFVNKTIKELKAIRETITSQTILNELYLLSESMTVSFGSSLVYDIHLMRLLKYGAFKSYGLMNFLNERSMKILDNAGDIGSVYIKQFIK